MIVRSVGTLELSRRAKAAGISMSHWSSRICCTTRSSARSARTNTSFSFIAGTPLCEPLKCRSSALSHASSPCATGERPAGSLRSHCDGLITPRASAIAADRLPGVSGSLRPARLIIAIAGALLIAYPVIWTQVSSFDVGRSDFTAFYVGGTLLREGHTGDLYSQAEQQPLHSELIAPDREGDLPFVNTPVAAALVLPVTFLPLAAAYRVWSVLELAVIVIAVVLAVRTVEWPAGTPRLWKAAAGAAALTGMGTWTLLVQAQRTPLLALGLVLACRSWKGGPTATGAAVVVVSAGIAKPHLALGLLAFLLGWRRRRIILGAIAGAGGLALASLALVGPSGIDGFVKILAGSTTRWVLANMLSFIGVVGSLFGSGAAAHLISLVATLLACAAD